MEHSQSFLKARHLFLFLKECVAHLSWFLGCAFQDTRVGHDFYIHWQLEDEKIELEEERYFHFCAMVKSSKCPFIAEQEKTG